MSIEAVLRQMPLFGDLTDEQLQELALSGSRVALDTGQVVFREGDMSSTMYIILTGRVKIYRSDAKGNEVELKTWDAGGYFGEWALIDSRPRSASVITLAPCEFFVLDQQAFHAFMVKYGSQMGFRIFASLIGRLRESTEKLFSEELARQALRAEMDIERHRALSQMVAGVAHEVNTPLGIVNTAVSICKNQLTSPALAELAQDAKVKPAFDDMLEAIDLMQRNIQRAHKLIQDFKKVSVSQLTDTKEELNLSEAVAEIVGLFKAGSYQAKMTIAIKDTLTDETRTWVGYRGYLSQVLLNLLTNVERYAYPRGIGGKVDMTLGTADEDHEPMFVITVRDFGQGIPPGNLPKVFEPFFTTGRTLGGTGLGLAIVRNIVTGPLQGMIELTSEVGQGTLVTITFPRIITD